MRGKVNTNIFRREVGKYFIIVQIYVDHIIFGAIDESLCKNPNIYLIVTIESFKNKSNQEILQHKINLGRAQKYDSIWFLHSFTYKQKRGNFIEQVVGNCKRMRKYKNKVQEIEQNKNKIQFKIKIINLIHQTNANRIITITMNDVQCESSVKCIRERSIESIAKLFEISNQSGQSSKQSVIKF